MIDDRYYILLERANTRLLENRTKLNKLLKDREQLDALIACRLDFQREEGRHILSLENAIIAAESDTPF